MRKTSILAYLCPILFLVITVCIYIPIAEFVGNITEFKVQLSQVICIILIPAAMVLLIGFAIGWMLKKKEKILYVYIDLLFGISLGIYFQFNFLNKGLRQLNGTEIAWNNTSTEAIISIVVWIVCLILPHIIRRISNKIEQKISEFGSAALSFMQLVSLIGLFVAPAESSSNDYVLTKNKEFELSSKQNVIVFIVDTLDAQWAEKYIISDPQYNQLLENFTYFNNVVSGGAPTMLGIPALLTGELYDTSINPWKYIEQANQRSTLISDLKSQQFSIRLYTDISFLQGSPMDDIDNITSDVEYNISDPTKFIKDIYKLTAYVGAPYQAKKLFVIYSGELTNNMTINNKTEELFLCDDPQFYKDYSSKGISLINSENVFVLYHLDGIHGPYSMNENVERVKEGSVSQEQQLHGVMKIICEYIEGMKEKDIFDNSTIIITADHGGVALYQNPAVFIKKAKETHPFQINSAPLTFKNLRSTFVEDYIVNYQEKYGPGMFDISEDADIPCRQHTYDAILHMNLFPDQNTTGKGFMMCNIGNPARNNDLILYGNRGTNEIKVNDIIYLYGTDARTNLVLQGFSSIESENRWTNAKEAIIPLQITGEYEDLSFSMKYKTFNGEQPVKVYANDHLILDSVLSGGYLEHVVISNSYIENGKLELKFYLPFAISPKELGISNDDRILALSIQSITISSE